MTFAEIFQRIGQLFHWWIVVLPWEQAIRIRFGKRIKVLRAGIHLKVPVIDVIFRQSVRRRTTLIRQQTMTTLDDKVITIGGGVNYSIVDILTLYNSLDQASDVIETEFMGAVAKYIRNRRLKDCRPGEMENVIRNHVDFSMYGLSKMDLFITDFAVVKTYRFIQGGTRDFLLDGYSLSTSKKDEE